MRQSNSMRVCSIFAVLAFGFGMPLVLPGCGGGDGQSGLIKPAAAPAISAKDSMNFYLHSSVHSKAKGTRRAFRR